MKKLRCRKVDIDLEPVEVARRLSHLEGLMFFDSSGNLSGDDCKPVSIIVASPRKVIRGEACDFSELRSEMMGYDVLDMEANEELHSFPVGGAFGWLDYSGDFCFGLYDSCLFFDHFNEQWYEVGELVKNFRDCELLDFDVSEFSSHTCKEDYINGVSRIQEYIRAGDIYQVNLTQC